MPDNLNTPTYWDECYAKEIGSGKRRIDDLRLHYLIDELRDYAANHRDITPRILDVGCGDGELLRLVHAYFPRWHKTGLDICPETLKRAREENPGMAFWTGGVESLTVEQPFDVIWCGETLEHLEDPAGAVAAMVRGLKWGGVLVCSVPNERGNPSPEHLREFTVGQAIALTHAHGRLHNIRVVRGDGWESIIWTIVRELP